MILFRPGFGWGGFLLGICVVSISYALGYARGFLFFWWVAICDTPISPQVGGGLTEAMPLLRGAFHSDCYAPA